MVGHLWASISASDRRRQSPSSDTAKNSGCDIRENGVWHMGKMGCGGLASVARCSSAPRDLRSLGDRLTTLSQTWQLFVHLGDHLGEGTCRLLCQLLCICARHVAVFHRWLRSASTAAEERSVERHQVVTTPWRLREQRNTQPDMYEDMGVTNGKNKK